MILKTDKSIIAKITKPQLCRWVVISAQKFKFQLLGAQLTFCNEKEKLLYLNKSKQFAFRTSRKDKILL